MTSARSSFARTWDQVRSRVPSVRFWRRDSGDAASEFSAMLLFALTCIVSSGVIAAGALLFARRAATDSAIDQAVRLTETVSYGIIEPQLTDAVIEGDQGARGALNATVRDRVLGERFVRVKLWTRGGVIVYSDEPELIDRQFSLQAEEFAAFDQKGAKAEVSDLSRPENAFEREHDKLLEVYLPVETAEGTVLLFEAYLPYSLVTSNASELWRSFLPALLAGMVVLTLVQLPLAWSLSHRLRGRQIERNALLQRAVAASERERKVIAGELHDGAVQALVGTSFSLTAIADRLGASRQSADADEIRQVSAQMRRTVQELRSLLVELYPPNLHSEGLERALEDLASPLRARDVKVSLSVAADLRLPESVERLLYRACREALRNILKHARASSVEVAVVGDIKRARLTLHDDGQGFSPAEREQRRAAGHLGLEMLEGAAADAGGTFEIHSAEGEGTTVVIEVPVS